MKRILFIILCFFAFNINEVVSQVNLGLEFSAGSVDIKAPYNNYRVGFKSGIGSVVYDEIKWIKDLSWETGLRISFTQTGFYTLKSGGFTVINGNYPLDKSEKLLHRF